MPPTVHSYGILTIYNILLYLQSEIKNDVEKKTINQNVVDSLVQTVFIIHL
jgi:hypothetical protein